MSKSTPLHGDVSSTLAASRLGVPDVIFFVMSAAAPLTVIAGAVTTAYAVTGITSIPVAFVAVAIVLALFSVGYVAMARHVSNAGAFYTYVTHGLGRPAGVGASFVALLAYNALQVALYGAFGIFAQAFVATKFGWDQPWWLYALGAWAIVAVLGLLRVDLNGKVLAVLLTAEILIVIVYDVASVGNPGPGGVTFSGLNPTDLFAAGAGAVLVTAVAGFIGFEGAAVFSEETKDPRKTVPRATYLAVAMIAILYAFSAWAMSIGTGTGNIVTASREQGPELMFSLATSHLGATVADIGRILFITSLFAALLSFHNTVARYGFALGREGVLPRALGRTNRRTGAPQVASVTQSALAIVVIGLFAAMEWDPLVQLFFWGGMFGAFGALILYASTSVAVVAFFARHTSGENVWRRVLAPALATAGLAWILYLAVSNFGTLLGVPEGDPMAWALPVAYPVVFALGFLWALILRGGRPSVYNAIGLGPNSVTGRATGGAERLGAPVSPAYTSSPIPTSSIR
jgi:amino acid transporter